MELKVKHLEFVQGVINRLSNNSFLLKGWSVVITSALLTLLNQNPGLKMGLISLTPVVVLWGLDGYYLSLERKYRKHFERIRTSNGEIDFSMKANDINDPRASWLCSTFSKSLSPFYGVLAAVVLTLTFVWS